MLRPGDWIVDDDEIDRAKADPSIDFNDAAWPVPARHRVISSSDWKNERAQIQKQRKGRK